MNLLSRSGSRARIIGTALLFVTFIAGALAGAASERVMRADEAQPQSRGSSEPRGGTRRLLLDEQFAKVLQLTPEQRTRIRTIMDRRDAEAKRVWSEAEPRLKALGAETRAEIEKVLTPEQQQKLEAEIARRHAAWKDRHKCHASDSTRAGKTT